MKVHQLNNKCSDYRLIFENVSLYAGDKVILENESFNITYNNIVILKGQIGSGKSTILKAVAGLQRLKQGNIYSYNKKYLLYFILLKIDSVFRLNIQSSHLFQFFSFDTFHSFFIVI